MAASPFKLTMYDKNASRLGWLGDPIEFKVTPRHMAIGDMSLTVRTGHPKLGKLIAPGSRLTCHYRGDYLMSAGFDSWLLEGGDKEGLVTIKYLDDFALLMNLLGWPNPTQPINAQNTGGVKEDKVTGPAETVAKTFITRNAVTRMGMPVTVAATHGWGSTITVPFRMVPLADNLLTVVEQAGVGLTVRQVGTSLVVDAYQPRTYPHTLTERSGVVIPGSASYQSPTATRTVVAGPGVGTSREWLLRVDTAREAEWGPFFRKEVLTDASSTEVTTEREAAGDAALIAAGPKSGFSLSLSESKNFRYGYATNNVRVGDNITFSLGAGIDPIADVLRESPISWTAGEGVKVTPTIGERTDDPGRKLALTLAAVVKKVRGITTNDSSGSSGDDGGGTF